MADQRLRITNFSGGESDDDKFGPKHSASKVFRTDVRKSPGLLRPMPTAVNEWRKSTTAATSNGGAEITDAVRVSNGDVYFCFDTNVLKRPATSNGSASAYVVLPLTVAGLTTAGYTATDADPVNSSAFAYYADYRRDLNTIFFYGNRTITEFNLTTNTWVLNKYYSILSIDGTANTGGNYPVPNAISEAEKFTFTVKSEPLYSIPINISALGTTGSFTVTVHDEANNVISAVTISPGAIGTYSFLFIDVRVKVDTSYHIHITSTGTGATIVSTSANTLPLAQISVRTNRLVPMGVHPTYQYGAKTYIANDRYVAEWEILDTSTNSTSGYIADRLILPSDYKAIGFAEYSEYIAIGCAINDSTDTNDNLSHTGAILFWNTTSQFIDWAMPIPDGPPNGLTAYRGGLHWECNGVKQSWAGGDIESDYQFPGTDDYVAGLPSYALIEGFASVNPKGMAVFNNLLHTGWPHGTTNANARIGVYSFGHRKSNMPPAVSYDYSISTGNTTPQFRTTAPRAAYTGVTMVKAFGNNLFIAWRDIQSQGTRVQDWGIDIVNNNVSVAATSGSYEMLWSDNGDPDKDKISKAIKVTMAALPAGVTITPKVRYDRSSTWELGVAVTTGAVDAVMIIDQRYYEAMVGFDWTSTAGNFFDVTSLSFKFDDNRQSTADTETPRAPDV
jgi:hypothetical protein